MNQVLTFSVGHLVSWAEGIMWPFIRISALLLAAPIFGAKTVPVTVRILFSLVLAIVVSLLLPALKAIDPLSLEGLLVTASQILIGVAMGFILQMIFSAVVFAGQSVALSMGLGFATLVDPQNGVQVPVVSEIYLILATLLFFALNGQLVFLNLIIKSFKWLPIGASFLPSHAFWHIAVWGGVMFATGMLIALPAVIALMLVNIGFGVITRAAPQLNIFAVGFPLTLFIGFGLMFFTLPVFEPRFEELMNQCFLLMRSILAG